MKNSRSASFKFYRWRNDWRRRRRLIFPSPAEVELIRIMGGKYITFAGIKDPKTGFPLTIIYDLGTILKREAVRREVRVGAMYIDLATVGLRYSKGVEVDGRLWHLDVVKEQERDEYVAGYGYALLHVNAADIYRDAARTQKRILNFLAH